MRIDPSESIYQEDDQSTHGWSDTELNRLRYILRRVQYLEHHIKKNPTSDRSIHSALEVEASVWLLREVGYLPDPATPQVSRNTA